ncbi:MAG: neutral zinc metallopeptidase [Chloroflexi bacterium]|nr:neutral zinc metallopeptidase [Chloroflexota bacterium]
MTFRPDAKLDPGQVQDRRGRRTRGGGIAIGGGLGGLVLLVALTLLSGGNLGDIMGGLTGGPGTDAGPASSDLVQECETGADANERQDCRIVGFVNSVQAYWTDAFEASGQSYTEADTVLFTDGVNTECGSASSAVGPFYCPLDQTIYIDLGFFEQLETQFGAEGGELAEAYVVAHEYGHHVQNLLGFLDAGRDAGAEGDAVRTELQADCFAGVWTGNAVDTDYLEPITQEQIDQALDAASVIGDDHIQEQTQGEVNQETWTHGSSEQRQQWFTTGLEQQDPDACNTFEADI